MTRPPGTYWGSLIAAALWGALCAPAPASWFTRYSPVNRERPARLRTDYIILHTTEAPGASAYRKLFENGEAHYMVDRNGRVYPIVRRDRLAYHAGLSMWKGRTDLDRCTIGIEAVGYYNGSLTEPQYAALRKLLAELKRVYGVSDDRVLTHSMVAYARPNKWFAWPHRGRKRCGMLFADPRVRSRLGLQSRPPADPDVMSRRLAVGDTYLARALYGSPAMARGAGGRR